MTGVVHLPKAALAALMLAPLLAAGPAAAQEGEAGSPTILLPDLPAADPASPGTAATPAADAADADSADAAPTATPPAVTPPATGPLPGIGAVRRDAAAPVPAAGSGDWRLGFGLPPGLPEGRVTMGASLPQDAILRLTGETVQQDMTLVLPDGAAIPGTLDLVLRSGINLLPQQSRLVVRVNDTEAGTFPLDQQDGWGQIAIPGDALVPGVNRILLDLTQHHRIFCGPEASFGVWTEIDMMRSGVSLAAGDVPLAADSFRVLATNAVSRGLPVEVRMQPGVDPATLGTVMQAVRAILPQMPEVRVLSPYDPVQGAGRRVGISIEQGTTASIRFLRNAQGALILRVTEGDGLDRLLAQGLGPEVAKPVLPLLEPGREVSFADLGQPLIVRNTRYADAEVPFRLPDDWMLLASQRATLNLRYGYGAGLPDGSILLVKVNGETISLLPLDLQGGAVLPPLRVRFPANLLQGGENRVSFEMVVPGDPPTLECPARETDMLAILGDSTLSVPPSPPMNLGDSQDDLLSIGGGQVGPMSDSGTLALPFQAQLAAETPPPPEPQTLVVGQVPQDLSRLPDRAALSRQQILQVLEGVIEVLPAPAASTPSQPATQPTGFTLQQAAPSGADTAAAEAEPAPGPRWSPRAVVEPIWNTVVPDAEPLADWIAGRSARAVLLAPAEGQPGQWSLVLRSGEDASAAALAFDRFRHDRAANGAEVALWLEDGSWTSWPPRPAPQLQGPVTRANLLAVVGNFASWGPAYYTAVLVGLALLSVLPAIAFVRLTRGKGNHG
ncbi:cellulose biosynthesis cyclic di-GMP-binding regulatory protein BcsB [Frigidibacter oleivorans]|uniref:cellulose biosynthesis cyclic di-GMP-binding regulatory protein BcsB n=1 Tax=Frigidibacter oleivorans TaxID=2487129 RepID=UPI000F8E8082|nr:cellulose biosynthesis cyclic di-GMP-binding regulatory protein BcsB [Frigidibacter oleivorans]